MKIKYTNRVNGKALYSDKYYTKDSIIFKLEGKISNKPTKYSIEIGEDLHIVDKYGMYMNHSFEPNTIIDGYNVVALNNISPDDELHFNYNENETNMACPFNTELGKVQGKIMY